MYSEVSDKKKGNQYDSPFSVYACVILLLQYFSIEK